MLSRLITNPCRPLAVLGLAVLLAGQVFAADPEYLTAVADLPLAPGLVEEVGAGISFDKPEGRIVEAVARGDVAPAAITAFYRAALPGLGWRSLVDGASGSRWQRGGEILSVEIIDSRNPLVVRFSIAPN
jgi:hypothetical protein